MIVLAHHATELFSKREREEVEGILHKYPVAAYLCGDAHEPWCKMINRVAEVTMGCMTYEKSVQAVFPVGEITPAGEVAVTAHEWRGHPGGWGEYSQFNNHFAELFPRPAADSKAPGPFGRDTLIGKISDCLRGLTPGSGKIVEVCGEPGIGKTTVCGEVMKGVPPEKRFQAALRGMASCAAAQGQILRSLGVAARDSVPLEAQIDAFAKTAPGATLYLDNAEDPLKDAAFKAWLLHDFPARSGWRVLYSTRTHMKHTNVTPFYVPTLDMPDAKDMFRSLFGPATAQDEASMEALLRDLSCHPLSIVLVAAQKDLYPSVQELHRAWRSVRDEAHDRFCFEDDTGPHASLRAALTMSFEAIRESRAARVLWGMMSFLPAQLPKALLDLAFSNDPPAAETAAAVLIKNSLMTAAQKDGKAVYAMLNPIKDAAFAFDKDAGLEPVREETVSRLVKVLTIVYTKADERKAQDRQEALYFALDILPDTLSCVEAILAKDAFVSPELFALLNAMRNRFKHNVTFSLDLLEKIVPDRNGVAAFLCEEKGDLKSRLGKMEEALQLYEQAETLYRQEQDNLGLANVLLLMGELERKGSRSPQAISFYLQAGSLYEQVQDPIGQAYACGELCRTYAITGEDEKAQDYVNRAMGFLDTLPPAVASYVAICVKEALDMLKKNIGKGKKKRKPKTRKSANPQPPDAST